MTVNGNIVTVGKWQFEIDRSVPKITTNLGGEQVENSITELTLAKEEIMIGITNQENINIDSTAQIKVVTEGISKNQYKWNIQNSNIAVVDENGNITSTVDIYIYENYLVK